MEHVGSIEHLALVVVVVVTDAGAESDVGSQHVATETNTHAVMLTKKDMNFICNLKMHPFPRCALSRNEEVHFVLQRC